MNDIFPIVIGTNEYGEEDDGTMVNFDDVPISVEQEVFKIENVRKRSSVFVRNEK